MIEVRCKKCHERLVKPGALIFGPPTADDDCVVKWHLCVNCWTELVCWVLS